MITKDKAYIAAGECLKKWKGMNQKDVQEYLKANFQDAWDEHDTLKKNKIDVSEAYSLIKYI